ncbi:hypothetical protein [Pedosphaera parvula]|uniref:Uncharacterized protein n=1 Tax=Pedosphaera parvula (strain Ellin514) TaxID=320771 RepID=B9XQM0_PEDPL|nr:hypothetical protein [Pedosphaera parvula]EEF57870.1 hypothetical protein Cflav_PD0934 [Pedosphaera parvula Ellin514]
MKLKHLVSCLALCQLYFTPLSTSAQGTAFSYQGHLQNNGVPANGSFDLVFTLFDSSINGNAIAGPLTNSAAAVSNGLFTATLDFGAGVFNGSNYWLAIAVQTNGGTGFTALSPLQPITPTPYAIFAPTAGTAATAASAASVQATNILGLLTGNGSGLTNLNGAQVTGTIPDAALSTNILAVKGYTTCVTNRWTAAGVYTVTVPAGVSQMVAKLWGAGGGRAVHSPNGGGGGYVQKTLAVTPGQVFTVVVGQRGSAGGGAGSGNAAGAFSAGAGGIGGQGSSVFYFTGSSYVLKALAGAGGGGADYDGGGAPGGNSPTPTGNGTTSGYDGNGGSGAPNAGQNYAANATTTGIASLNQAGGSAGAGSNFGGGGGGGYGGGGGGGYQNFSNSGGGGGGSYGDAIIAGNSFIPGNTNDSFYVSPAGFGGTANPDGDGEVVLLFQLPAVNTPGFIQAARVGAAFLTGDGSGVTNVNASSGNGSFTGAFNGNASGLTNVNASSGNGSFTGNFSGSGSLTGTVAGSVSGTISGNGAGLTDLNAANISSGIANDSILSANIPRLNANANFNGTVGATNFVGNGAGLTNVPWVIKWNVVSGISQTAVGNNGYLLTNNSAQVVVTLPTAPNVGEIVRVAGTGSAGWKLAQYTGQSILASQIGGQFGVVWIPSVNSGGWQSIACSADGTRLVGVSQNQLFTSTDGGNNWIHANSQSATFLAVASSADGTHLAAVAQGNGGFGGNQGGVFTSADSGVSWNQKYYGSSDDNFTCVCSSDDGTRLYAGNSGSYSTSLYRSTDSGASWAPTSLSSGNIRAITCSADGTRVCAVFSSGNIWASTDSGATWTQRDAARNWSAVASSTDGMKLVATVVNGQIYTSSNGGTNWTAQSTTQYWQAVASSGDGNRLLAAVSGGSIYISGDAGVTWTARDAKIWTTVASSRDGTRLFGGTYDRVYRSSPTSVPTTTVGTAGYLNAPQYGTIELQHIGAGVFLPLSSSGTFEVK